MTRGSMAYAEFAVHHRALATLSQDAAAQAELNDLAARYEHLAAVATRLSEKYLAVTELPGVTTH